MGTFTRLMRRLHSVFDKDAQSIAVIRLATTYPDAELTIADGYLRLNKGGWLTAGRCRGMKNPPSVARLRESLRRAQGGAR